VSETAIPFVYERLERFIAGASWWLTACPYRLQHAPAAVRRSANKGSRQMKPVRHLTTMMMLAALAAVGCSKNNEPAKAKDGSTVSLAGKVTDEEGVVAVGTTITTSSFADGEAAYHAKKYGEATAIFDAYVGRRANNAWGHYMLGLSAWKSGDFKKSEKAFDQALSLDPNHVKSLVNSSRLFLDQKRHDDAIARLTRAAEIDPESIEVTRLLARTYVAQGKTEEAIETYQRVIDVNEQDAWAQNNLGLLFLETQRAGEALPHFAKAVELRKDVALFNNNFGMALEHTGRFKAAAVAYGNALVADPGYEKAKD
jgi:tetratricopeptide (TPR) repeat protein